MNGKEQLFIINRNCDIIDAFGTMSVLDGLEWEDQSAVYDFARIVSNYMKMQKFLCDHKV
jgi:hypothetical protein